jgi:putative ABC transport system permease protein
MAHHPQTLLDRKLVRDLIRIWSQALAIALVMAAGIAMFVMARSALRSLETSRAAYYRDYRFADLFASLRRAPRSLLPQLRDLPGVSAVSTRIVTSLSLDVPDMDEPAIGKLVSIPDRGQPDLNDLYLKRGAWPDPERADEVLCSETFADAHQLGPGDRLAAILNGRKRQLRIAGIALSPEYIIQIQPGNLLPDDRRFGVFWMCERQMAAAFDMEGAFNDVCLQLERGTGEQAVIDAVDRLLEPWGGAGAYDRELQISYRYTSDEIQQLGTMAMIAPTIFLAVAAFLLSVVIGRLVGLEREQIAALKAFGFSPGSIGWHYYKLVFAIALCGTAIGITGGWWMGRNLTSMYAEIYHFPVFQVQLDWRIPLAAAGISLGASLLGAWRSVMSAVYLPPAQAMRPERLGFSRLMPQTMRMVLRHVERRPWRSLTAISGISMSVAVLILGVFVLDAVQYIMHFQFVLSQRQQLSVALYEPTSPEVVHAIRQLPGVGEVQPFRAVSTRLRKGHRWRSVGLMGLDDSHGLYRLLDADERPVPMAPGGLVLSDKLAELLDARAGDRVTVEVLEGNRRTRSLPVSAVIKEYGGLNAYLPLTAVRLLGEDSGISGAFIEADPDRLPELYRTLKDVPRVAGITIKDAALRSFQETIAENLLTMRAFNVMFAVIIAFGVVYNGARISLSEQSRELATLRVMGFTQREVSAILLGELAVQTLLAIPLGIAAGFGLAALFIQGMDTEMYRIPLVISRQTLVFSVLVVVIATILSGLVVQRRIGKLDLVAVLKTRE